MATATVGYLRVQKNIQSKIGSMSLPSINWRTVCLTGILMSSALLVFYVCQINDLTKGYYTINGYQKQINMLSEENKNLEISFAENSFLGQALLKIQALNFQKNSSVKYIKILDNSAEAKPVNKNI